MFSIERYEKIMVTIGAQRKKIYEKYRDDVQFQFDVVLIEGTDFYHTLLIIKVIISSLVD